jgi:protein O-mannosyl-transferase
MPTSSVTKRRRRRSAPAPKQAQKLRLIPEVTENAPERSSSFAKFRLAPAILLTLITLSVYLQVIHLPFTNYDDGEYVQNNTDIQRGITKATVRWAVTSTEHANWHPLTWLSHALDWQLFGDNAAGHHFTSLLLHILNVLLLFFLLARITGSTAKSLFVAALFAVHPINVESVVWIAERKNVLCTLFFLLTLIAYSWYARRPNIGRYLAMALLFALALSAKAMVVTLPFVLLLVDFWPLQRIRNWSQPSETFPVPQSPAWKIALEKLPLLAMSAGVSVLTMIAQHKANAIKSAKFSLSGRLANAIVSYATYLWKTAWPTHLAVFYPHFAGRVGALRVLLCGLLLVAVSAWVWRERARPYLIVGWCWFLGMMVPVIGLVQVGDQGMADRYAYLPLIGIFVALVWGVADLVQTARDELRRSVVVVATLALIFFSVLASRQVHTWRTPYDLWSQAISVDPNNSIAEDVVGSEILMGALNRGLATSSEAQVHFQRALQIDPRDSDALLNIGADLQAHGRIPEAIATYKEALQYVEDTSLKTRILSDLGSAYERVPDIATSRKYYLEALNLSPKKDPTAFAGFARTFTDEQITELARALSAKPTAEGYLKLGQLQESAGYTEDAIASYHRALQIDSKFEAARSALRRFPNSGQPQPN